MPDFGHRTRRSRAGSRKARARVLVLCGGEETESIYFEYVKEQLSGSGISVKIATLGQSPSQVLTEAVRLRDQEARQARSRGDETNTFDAVWIVIDVDEFAMQISGVLSEAMRKSIGVAISNPCFELWLSLHVGGCDNHVTTKQAQLRAARDSLVGGKRNKVPTIQRLRNRFTQAEARAKKMRENHVELGRRPPEDNPSTCVDLLVRSLIEASLASDPQLHHGL
nr:RloB domain-containing protein [Propionibacterium sp.]